MLASMSHVKAGASSERRGSRRQLQSAATRGALLEAAQKLFVERGFEQTSIESITRAAEASKGTYYNHFTDKREIFAEVFQGVQEAIMLSALRAAADVDDPWQRLEVATRAFLRTYVADTGARIMLREALSVLGWDRMQHLDEATALPYIRTSLEQFIAADQLVDVDIEASARLVFGLYCEGILIVTASKSPSQTASSVETTILAMLQGLRATRPGA